MKETDPIKILLDMYDPSFVDQEARDNPPPAPPFTVKSWGDIHRMILPPRDTFLGDIFALGCIQSLMGQGGVGKSRISLNLARNNVLGLPFCGLSTGTPKKWLFIGNENSAHRWQRDIVAMSAGLTAEQKALLAANIHVQVIESPDDAFICLSDETIKQKWHQTIAAIKPDIVVGDPWGEIQYGDPNNDLDTRQSIRDLVRICNKVNVNMALVILHHARTGRQNIIQAAGWDKGNFGKGSKALYSGARAVINIAPADPDDHSKLVMVCAKTNDAKPFETMGIKLDEETMTYDVDPDFDLEAWTMDVEGKRAPAGTKLVAQDVVDACQKPATKRDIIQRLMDERGAGKSAAYNVFNKAVENGLIREGKNGWKTSGKIPPRVSVKSEQYEELT